MMQPAWKLNGRYQGVLLRQSLSIMSGGAGVPKLPQRSEPEKKQWKNKLKASEGATFQYSVTGFDTTLFRSDTATATIHVETDGAISCTDPVCAEAQRHQFGRTPTTRGEFNAHKHVTSYHRPSRRMKDSVVEASSSQPMKQGGMLAFGFSRRVIPKKGASSQDGSAASSSSSNSQTKSSPSSNSADNISSISSAKSSSLNDRTDGDGDSSLNALGGWKRGFSDDSSSDIESIHGDDRTPSSGADGANKVAKRNRDDSPSSSLSSPSSFFDSSGAYGRTSSGCDVDLTGVGSKADSSFPPINPVPKWADKFAAAAAGAKPGTSIRMCYGADIILPSPHYRNYPMSIEQVIPGISKKFVFDFVLGNVMSTSCSSRLSLEKLPDVGDDDSVMSDGATPYRCYSCLSLSDEPLLRSIVDRAHDDNLHLSQVNNAYLTDLQKERRLKHHMSQNNLLKLEALNNNRKLKHVCKRRDEQKHLVAAIAEGNTPRQHQILTQAAKKNRSVKATLQMIADARNGKYHPKGYTPQDMEEAILVWKLGSIALVYAENHSYIKGGPSLRSIQRRANIPIYTPMYSNVIAATVKLNCDRFLFDESRHSPSDGTQCLRVMMIDDVKAEARGRFCNRSGQVVGLCGCASKNHIPTDINSVDDCEAIARALDSGDAHLATEITNVAIGPIREKDYQPTFIATSAGCLSNDPPERLEHLLRASITTYVDDPRGEATLGRLTTIQPDGAGAFVLLGHSIFFSEPMTDKHPLHKHLHVLPLFNLYTGAGVYKRATMGCEQKHAFKRTKERIKGEVGITMLNFKFTGSFLQDLLMSTRTLREEEIKTIFNVGYADAMNVPAMVKLYRAIADMAELEPSEFGQRQAAVEAVRDELRLLGKFCGLIWTVLCDKTPSLGSQLENIACLAHIVFVCYRRNGTKFLPSQNYGNLQRYFRSVYWSIANAIEDRISTYFLFQDSGDRLEEAYGLLRCLCGGASGNGSGMDVLQCTERIAGVMTVQGVLARNPQLRKGSRHLRTSEDHQNPRSFLSNGEEGQDRRRINVEGISLQHKFVSGRSAAKDALADAGFSQADVDWIEIAKEKDVDLLRPKGKFVGITERDDEVEKPGGPSRATGECTDDAVLFEEEIGSAPDSGSLSQQDPSSSGLIKRTFKVNGQDVSAAKCLRLALTMQPVSETSRTARYQGKTKSGTEVGTLVGAEDEAISSYLRASEEMFATLVVPCTGCIAMAILNPDQFILEDGTKSSKVDAAMFTGRARVHGRIVTNIVVLESEIRWAGSSRSAAELEVYAEDTLLLNPDMQVEVDEKGGEKMILVLARDAAEQVREKLVLSYLQRAGAKSVLPVPKNVTLPYRYGGNDILCSDVPSDKILSSKSTRAATRASNATLKCAVPRCGKEFPAKDMRHHVAYHILHDPNLSSKLGIDFSPLLLCGVCACHRATTYTADSSTNDCPAWLKKGKGKVLHFEHSCKEHPSEKISYKAALKYTSNAPSTNIPINCPECAKGKGRGRVDQAFYKYSFRIHWDANHSDVTMPTDLCTLIEISDEERSRLKSFADPRTKRNNSACTSKANSTKKKPPSLLSKSQSSTLRQQSIETISAGSALPRNDSTDDLSIRNASPLLLRSVSGDDRAKARGVISDAKSFCDTNPIDSDLAKRDAELGYSYEGHAVGSRAFASLSGSNFINDEIVDALRAMCNGRNARLISEGKLKHRCFVVGAFFAEKLLGLYVAPQALSGDGTRTRRPRTLGMQDTAIPFSSSLRSMWRDDLCSWPRKWANDGLGTPFRRDEHPSVFDAKWDSLIFQLNITRYHWLYAIADFEKKAITLQDSDPIVNETLEIKSNADRIITKIEDKPAKDLDVATLRTICTGFSLPTVGEKASALYRLIRVMFLQELLLWIQDEGRRASPPVGIELSDWTLLLSTDMPRQLPGNMNCSLFTSLGCDKQSKGESLNTITNDDASLLETRGRCVAALLIMQNSPTDDESQAISTDE